MALPRNINNELYYKSACELGFRCTKLPAIDGLVIHLGSKNYFFRGGYTPFNNSSSLSIAENKFCMNSILRSAGIPVPKATAITQQEYQQANYSLNELNFPLVVKPTQHTQRGEGVLCNIQDKALLHSYLREKFRKYNCLSIEEFHGGLKSYRILVFFNKVIAVAQRIPAHIIGDGIHSINELIQLTNQAREVIGQKVSLSPLRVDAEYEIRLAELGLTLDSIPKQDEYVQLCYACNTFRGGTAIAVSEKLCKENEELAIKAAKVLNLNLVGFDVECEDISIPIVHSKGVFIEANHHPDITIHEAPLEGKAVRVSKMIVQRLIYQHPFRYLRERFRTHL